MQNLYTKTNRPVTLLSLKNAFIITWPARMAKATTHIKQKALIRAILPYLFPKVKSQNKQ